jgi:hypothetical protein
MQDELIIAGVCKGIDTIEAANKSTEMRGILAGMKTRAKKQAGKLLIDRIRIVHTQSVLSIANTRARAGNAI